MTLTTKLGPAVDIGVSLYPVLADSIFTNYSIANSAVFGYLNMSWFEKTGTNSREFFGYPGGWTNEIVSFHGLKPVSVPYDQTQDYNRYSFPLGEAARQLSLNKGYSSAFENENQVSHLTLHGEVSPIKQAIYTFHPVDIGHGAILYEADQINYLGQLITAKLADEDFPVGFGPSISLYAGSAGGRMSWQHVLKQLAIASKGAESNPVGPGLSGPSGPKVHGPYGGFYGGIANLKTDGLTTTWDEWRAHPVYYNVLTLARVRLYLSLEKSSRQPIHDPKGNCLYNILGHVSFDTEGYVFDGTVTGPGCPALHVRYPAYDASGETTIKVENATHFPVTHPFDSSEVSVRELFSDSVTLRGFFREAIEGLRWCRPSANQVLVDLVQTVEMQTDNWIEFFKEIDELTQLFPADQLRLAFESVESAELPARLRALALAVAGGYLLYSFGWRPLVGTPQAAIDVLNTLADRCDILNETATVHLAKSFDMEGKSLPAGIVPHRLQSRTRVTVGGFKHPATSTLLALDSLGILPTAKRLWEVTIWSFVADYFFNLSDRFATLEAYVFAHLLDTRDYVHSFTGEFDMGDSFLSQFGLMGVDKPVIRVYMREKSIYVPALFNAATASLFITEKPNWLIILALLVTFLL